MDSVQSRSELKAKRKEWGTILLTIGVGYILSGGIGAAVATVLGLGLLFWTNDKRRQFRAYLIMLLVGVVLSGAVWVYKRVHHTETVGKDTKSPSTTAPPTADQIAEAVAKKIPKPAHDLQIVEQHETKPKVRVTVRRSNTTQGTNGVSVGGSINQGPGSIAQIGGSGNQASITNIGIEPPLPKITWTSKALVSTVDQNPAVELELKVAGSLSNPTFRALCDHPCESESGSIHVPSAVSQTQGGWDDRNANVAILHFNIPSLITPDMPVGWTLRSKDKEQVRVLEINAIRIP